MSQPTSERGITYLTPEAYERLSSELNELKTEGRERVSAAIGTAREHGDIRENADYDAAKNEQGLMEARIRKLEHLINTAEIVEVTSFDRVEIGCLVTVLDSDGDEMEYFVAATENKVPGVLLASPTSPLGAALIGAQVGDEVAYQAPAGTFTLKVTGIRPFDG